MPDIHVSHDNSERGVGLELGETCLHRVQERVLGVLLGGAVLTRVHICAHDSEGLAVDVEVGLDPPTRLV